METEKKETWPHDEKGITSEIIEKKEKQKITPEMREALKADFPDKAYKKHDSKSFLTTLKAMYVVERLNDVFGIGRWDLRHSIINSDDNYVLMKGRLYLLDYDCVIPEQYGGHATSGTGKEKADGYKSAITDILSKSASYLEIGIEMFKGNITPTGDDNTHDRSIKKLNKKDIPEFLKKWNGKIYGKNSVFFNNAKYFLDKDQLEWLKKQEKYIPEKS